MNGENAGAFADAILHREEQAELSSDSFDTDSSMSEGDDEFAEGLEGTYNMSSTYFDIFDNLMRKYIGDLNTRDELRAQLNKELGNQSVFLYQRLNKIEERSAQEFLEE